MSLIRAHLADNRGDENISKMIWIAIVFVVGAVLLALVVGAFKGPISNWFKGVIDSWFNSDESSALNGAFDDQGENPWAGGGSGSTT